jgi:hypothetical protein
MPFFSLKSMKDWKAQAAPESLPCDDPAFATKRASRPELYQDVVQPLFPAIIAPNAATWRNGASACNLWEANFQEP